MANVDAHGTDSFGVNCNEPDATNDKMTASWNKVKSLKPAKHKAKPNKFGTLTHYRNYNIFDLNMMKWIEGKKTTNTIVDLIPDVEIELDEATLKVIDDALGSGEYNKLPGVFGPKDPETSVPMTLNLNFHQMPGVKYMVVKYIAFLKTEKLDVIRREILQGTLCCPHCSGFRV